MTTDEPPVRSVVPDGFDELYRADWHAVVALGWSLTGSWTAGEELAQDAFLDAFRRWDHVGVMERPGGWVRRAVANRAVSRRRHLRVVADGERRLEDAARLSASAGDHDADAAPDPVFWAAVRALPERQAQCIALRYLEDLEVAEIAELLEMRASTVRVHLSRGRRTLARTLDMTTSEEDR